MSKDFGLVEALARIAKALTSAGHRCDVLAEPTRLRVDDVELCASERKPRYGTRGVLVDLGRRQYGGGWSIEVTRTGKIDVGYVLDIARLSAEWEKRESRQKSENAAADALRVSATDLPGTIRIGTVRVMDDEAPPRCSFLLDTHRLSVAGISRVLEAYKAALEVDAAG